MTITPYLRKVQFYETDQMAIVHHSNYIRWFEEARVDYMEQIGYGYAQANAAGIDFAVLAVDCRYKSMTRFGETVAIELAIAYLDATKITLAYTVRDSVTGQVRATGETKHCYFHNVKKRPVPLKKELPHLYELFVQLVAEQPKASTKPREDMP